MMMLTGLALLFGAAVCFVLGVKLLIDNKKKQSDCTAPAMAQLLRYDEEIRTDTDEALNGDIVVTKTTLHYPVFSYQAREKSPPLPEGGGPQDRGVFIARHSHAVSKNTWAIGTLVPIRYDPEQPDRFVIAGDKNASVLGYVTLAAGLLCLVFGIAMLRG